MKKDILKVLSLGLMALGAICTFGHEMLAESQQKEEIREMVKEEVEKNIWRPHTEEEQ